MDAMNIYGENILYKEIMHPKKVAINQLHSFLISIQLFKAEYLLTNNLTSLIIMTIKGNVFKLAIIIIVKF